MRSDNNKPWGTHRTVEVPPAQLGWDFSGGHKIRGDSHTGGDTATAWHCHLLLVNGAPDRHSQADVGGGRKGHFPRWDTPAAPSPSLCVSRAGDADAEFGASAMKRSEITRSDFQKEWNGTQFHS